MPLANIQLNTVHIVYLLNFEIANNKGILQKKSQEFSKDAPWYDPDFEEKV